MKCKICSKCKIEKSVTEFNVQSARNGFTSHCKQCRAEYRKLNKAKIQSYKKLYAKNNKEKIRATYRCYYILNCEKIKAKSKTYYVDNIDYVKKQRKQYHVDNAEKLRLKTREWRRNNRSRRNEYERNKRKTNSAYKLRQSVSSRIGKLFKEAGFKKSYSSKLAINKILHYDFVDLKLYIESKFEPWMSWENWGSYNPKTWDDNNQETWTWNLDHIIPLYKLPYDSYDHPNFHKAWALENLRPLNSKQNILENMRGA